MPAEVRNRVNSAKGSLRIHGGLLTISRSRTFLSLSSNSKSSIHSSTPDLSRSVPNTPGSNHKISLTSSYDSVLEENEEDGVIIIKKGKAKDKKKNGKRSTVQQIFGSNNVQIRRKSEELLDSRKSSTSSSNVSMIKVPKDHQHSRQGSDQSFRLIPRIKKPTAFVDDNKKDSRNFNDTSRFQSTSRSTEVLDVDTNQDDEYNDSRWGNVRGSNSFAANLNISSLSTYAIPRVSLSHHKMHLNDAPKDERAPRKSLPESRLLSTFHMRHDTDDSAA